MFNLQAFRESGQRRQRPFLTAACVLLAAIIVLVGLGYWHDRQNAAESTAAPSPTGSVPVYEKLQATNNSTAPELTAKEISPVATNSPKKPALPQVAQKVAQKPANSPSSATKQPASKTNTTKQKKTAPQEARPTISTYATDPDILEEAWPPPPNAPRRTDSTFLVRIPNMLLMLGIVCLVVWGVLKICVPFIGKLTGTVQPKKLLSIVERQQIGPGKAIMVVKVANKHLLVGMTDRSINTLAELTEEDLAVGDPPASPGSESASVTTPPPGAPKNLLKEVLNQHISALPLSNSDSEK